MYISLVFTYAIIPKIMLAISLRLQNVRRRNFQELAKMKYLLRQLLFRIWHQYIIIKMYNFFSFWQIIFVILYVKLIVFHGMFIFLIYLALAMHKSTTRFINILFMQCVKSYILSQYQHYKVVGHKQLFFTLKYCKKC